MTKDEIDRIKHGAAAHGLRTRIDEFAAYLTRRDRALPFRDLGKTVVSMRALLDALQEMGEADQ